jgi:cold shock CspA family protein
MLLVPPSYKMQVLKYIPERLYGFVGIPETNQQAFFHLGVFDPKGGWAPHTRCTQCSRGCPWSQTAPPPILGEPVIVLVDLTQQIEGKAARATRVERTVVPVPLRGTVETFDAQRGYGFVAGSDGKVYHLHQSEVTETRIPLPRQIVFFYPGVRENKPRACHVRLCWDQTP